MATMKEEAQAYEPPQTKTVAELESLNIDMLITSDSFECTKKDGEGNEILDDDGQPIKKRVNTQVVEIEGEKYRVPKSVLKHIKAILKVKPDLKTIRVLKSGIGLQTEYTVIPVE